MQPMHEDDWWPLRIDDDNKQMRVQLCMYVRVCVATIVVCLCTVCAGTIVNCENIVNVNEFVMVCSVEKCEECYAYKHH